MTKLKILVLTDHKTHAPSNSVYNLCNALILDERVESVYMASRGQATNSDFFFQFSSTEVVAYPINNPIDYYWGQEQIGITPGKTVKVNQFDLVWLRLPRPIPDGFFDFLEKRFPNQIILNRPWGIETSSDKSWLLNVHQLCPPIRLCKTIEEIDAFSRSFEIVIKPLEDYGGRGIVRVNNGQVINGDKEIPISEYASELTDQLARGGYLGMKFLKGVSAGDKRVVVANGQVIGGILRMPAAGSWLCNASQGGEGHVTEVDEAEIRMAKVLHEKLAPLGIAIFGMDTLMGDGGERVLSEVNTLSIGGIAPLDEISDIPASEMVAKNLIDFAKNIKNA